MIHWASKNPDMLSNGVTEAPIAEGKLRLGDREEDSDEENPNVQCKGVSRRKRYQIRSQEN